ncbi:MAG: LysR family transcriptional regulator, partial [Oxalobacteraceae bacterium]
LATHHTREIVSALLLGEADLALSLQDPRHPGIKAEVIASGAMVALCPHGSPEAADDGPLALADIRSEIVGLHSDDPLAGLLHHAGEASGRPLASRLTVQTYQLARALVEAGVGMTLVDPFTAASADITKVKVRPLTPSVTVHLHLLSAASAPLGQASRRLVKFITAAAHEHLARL